MSTNWLSLCDICRPVQCPISLHFLQQNLLVYWLVLCQDNNSFIFEWNQNQTVRILALFSCLQYFLSLNNTFNYYAGQLECLTCILIDNLSRIELVLVDLVRSRKWHGSKLDVRPLEGACWSLCVCGKTPSWLLCCWLFAVCNLQFTLLCRTHKVKLTRVVTSKIGHINRTVIWCVGVCRRTSPVSLASVHKSVVECKKYKNQNECHFK